MQIIAIEFVIIIFWLNGDGRATVGFITVASDSGHTPCFRNGRPAGRTTTGHAPPSAHLHRAVSCYIKEEFQSNLENVNLFKKMSITFSILANKNKKIN